MPPKQFTHKVCPGCFVNKPREDYYKKGDYVTYKCKPCTLLETKARQADYYDKYADRKNEWKRTKYAQDPQYREHIAAQKKAAYDARIDEINAKRRDRWATDPYNPARLYYRRKDIKDKTPAWADKGLILEIYAKCPEGHEVDHIVPLRGLIDGRPVSGLHVQNNLQYLTREANRKKKNKISESDLNG